MDYEERKNEMHLLHFQNGWTMQEVGDKFGISRERVRQIIGNSRGARRKLTEALALSSNSAWTSTQSLINLANRLVNRPVKSVVRKKIASVHHLPKTGGYLFSGIVAENRISEKLTENGVKHQLMPIRHPFDILTESGKRIDVKSTLKTWNTPRGKTPFYRFAINKHRKEACDYFILFYTPEEKMWIIPANLMPKVNTVYISTDINDRSWDTSNRWNEWVNRFDLLQ